LALLPGVPVLADVAVVLINSNDDNISLIDSKA
jgi:hypothetical protein